MNLEILYLLKGIFEKQSQLAELTQEDILKEYSLSEIHTVDIIGIESKVNGMLISKKLNLTRSAVSKIISKLKDKEVVYSYKVEDNKKEIYYNLTEKGKEIYESHKKAHKDWENREVYFLEKLEKKEKEIVNNFLKKYDDYLIKLIDKGEKNRK